MEALASAERAFEEKLRSLTQAKVRVQSSDSPATQDSVSSTRVVEQNPKCANCVHNSFGPGASQASTPGPL